MPPLPLPYAALAPRRRRRGFGDLLRPLAAVVTGAAAAYSLATAYRRHLERLQEEARRECAPREKVRRGSV